MTRGSVLVSGASGFLGRAVTEGLLARGYAVRALVRPGSGPAAAGATPVRADGLHDRASLARALAGVEAVVHLAARVHVMRDPSPDPLAQFRRVNVEGTRALLEETVRAGVGRFLFASSVKALGEGGETPWDDRTPAAPTDPYGISKLEAEEVVRALGGAAGVHAPILRLPLVYGPGVRANFLRLMRAVDRGVPLPFGAVRNRRSLAFSGNVAAAVVRALEVPEANETFLFSDGEDVSTPELVRGLAAALGRRARLLPVPPALFRAAGRAGDALRNFVPFPLTSAAVERLLGSLVVDSSRFRARTGFTPPFTVATGLGATGAWYRLAHANP
jgi:UDP-4-keto-D-QuiNAc 4-reductase